MIVVSDTTPLISLMKANKLEILRSLFQEVLIPETVYNELTGNSDFQTEADYIRNADYIRCVRVKEQKAVNVLQRATGLDLGESEAIVYADDVKADVLLMDEARGRQVAKAMRIQIMGTVGLLLYAFEEKILSSDDVVEALDALKRNNRHIADGLYKQALETIGKQQR